MVKDNIIPNHMNIYWHDYTGHVKDKPITEASLPVKAALIGRVGLMLLSCGTGAWRVRSSMNALSEQLGVPCTASIGLMTIVYTCFDGNKTFTNSLALNNTGVNTSKLNQLERFVKKFPQEGVLMSGEQLHSKLDEIEKIRGLYTPLQLGLAAAVACAAFTFLLGGGPILYRCRSGKLPALSPYQKALYALPVYYFVCGTCLSVVHSVPAPSGNIFFYTRQP